MNMTKKELQDSLFKAWIESKRKLGTLGERAKFSSIKGKKGNK